MSSQIHRPHTVDFSKFQFGDPTVNKYGGKSCRVKYDNADFYMQLPRMRLPYGLGVYQEKDSNGNVTKQKFSMDFSLSGYEAGEDGQPKNTRVKECFDWLEGMEQLLVEKAVENSSTWLDMGDCTEGVAKALSRDLIKYARDKTTKKITNKYPPTFKSKVGYWDGRFTLNAFDEKKQPIQDLQQACPKGSEAVAIIKLTGVTFAGGKCGYSFNVHQVKVYAPSRMPSYAFLDDEEDSKPAHHEVEDDDQSTSTSGGGGGAEMVEDSDEEEEEEDDEEDELDVESEEEDEKPPTPPPAKKKVVRRRKKDSK